MNRKLVGSAIAVLLAAVGTFILIAYVQAADERAIAGERVVPVLVVREPIAKGTRAEDIGARAELERVPAKVLAAGGVSDIADIEDKVVAVDLVPGEQLVEARFQSPLEAAQAGGVEVPEGLQEVTVALTADRAAGGRVQPGDTVGVVASFAPFDVSGAKGDDSGEEETAKTPNTSHLILHKVLVTDVRGSVAVQTQEGQEGQEGQAASAAPGEVLLVTLAVEANAVEKIVFTQEFGFVYLSAEGENAAEEPTQIETRGSIYE